MRKRTYFNRYIFSFYIFLIIGSFIFPYLIVIRKVSINPLISDNLLNTIPIQSQSDTITHFQDDLSIINLSRFDKNLNSIEDELDRIIKLFPDDYEVDLLIDVEEKNLYFELERFREFGKIDIIINSKNYCRFSGKVDLKGLKGYIKTSSGYSFIQIDRKAQFNLRKSLEQLRIYPDIRHEYSLKGDNHSTIAIIDQGIDDTHPALKDKIIYWQDFTSENYPEPQDERGHGTQVASVACGKPYNTTDSCGRTIYTHFLCYNYTNSGLNFSESYYQTFMWLNLTHEGNITVQGNWFNPVPDETPVNITEIFLENLSQNVALKEFIFINQTFTLNYEINESNFGFYQIKVLFNFTSTINPAVGVNLTVYFPENNSNIENLYSGVAPNVQVIMLRAITKSEIELALDWIIDNYKLKNITTVVMSFRIWDIDGKIRSKANELVLKGVIVACAAGNDGSGQNFAGAIDHSPGCADKVISVGAVNQNNSLASYSSQGGSSPTGNTIKPDLLAPGGELISWYLPNQRIYCADSNDKEYFSEFHIGKYDDLINNDTSGVAGTSFSAPIVGGIAQLIIEKLGGVENWNFTESEALFIKNLIIIIP